MTKRTDLMLQEHNDDEKCGRFLKSMENLDSTLPHDRIYGLFAILQKMDVQLPGPNYSEPFEKVVGDFTRAFIKRFNSLDLFTMEVPTLRAQEIPSWIPGYLASATGPNRESQRLHNGFYKAGSSATRESKPYFSPTSVPGKLLVRGERVGTLTTTLACASELPDPATLTFDGSREFIRVCQQWCQFCATLPNGGEAIENSFTSNMLYSPEWSNVLLYPNCRDTSLSREIERYSESSETDPVTIIINYLKQDPAVSNTQLHASLFQIAANGCANWALVRTDTGYLGRAYRTCQNGDQVWLLAGSTFPVVLREVEDTDHFTFITPAYFATLMDGKYWPEDTVEGLKMINLV